LPRMRISFPSTHSSITPLREDRRAHVAKILALCYNFATGCYQPPKGEDVGRSAMHGTNYLH